MTIEERILNLEENKILNKEVLYDLIKETHPNYKETSIRWVIYKLVKEGIISRLSATQYIVGKVAIYHQQNNSEERNKVVDTLNQAFPNIRVVVYESTLLNEWLNHQIARKVVFIEVEKYFMKDVFRLIYKEYPKKALLNPTKEDLSMYDGELMIVAQLISQAPINQKTKEIKIEKLIVDLYTKDLITEFINDDEKEDVIGAMMKAYSVNVKTIYAYAKRRKNIDILKKVVSSYELGGRS